MNNIGSPIILLAMFIERKIAKIQHYVLLSDLVFVPDNIHEWKPRGENQGLSQCPD